MSGLMANKELSSVISLTIIILLPIISRTNINVSAYAAVAQAEIPANKAEVSNLLGSKNVEMPANIPSPILINDRKRSIQDASFANDPVNKLAETSQTIESVIEKASSNNTITRVNHSKLHKGNKYHVNATGLYDLPRIWKGLGAGIGYGILG